MEIRQYLAIGLKWWWLIVLVTVIAAAVGYFYSLRQPTIYRASTTILVGQTFQTIDVNALDLATTASWAQTYADIAQSQPMLQEVVNALDLNMSWRGLGARVKVQLPDNSQLLQITVTGRSLDEARTIADEFARQLIRLSPAAQQNQGENENERLIRQRLESLQARIEAGQQKVNVLEAELEEALSVTRARQLQTEINEVQRLIASWESNSTQLLIFVESESKKLPNYLTIVEPARASFQPPETLSTTLTGAAVGFILAIGLIFLIEYLDDTIKSPDDLNWSLQLTALGTVGRIKGKSSHDKLIIGKNHASQTAETYRMMRTNIQFIAVGQSIKSIVVASPSAGEGKSLTVANLGVVLAQAGFKTIIVDTDLRQPVLHEIFDLSNTAGLTKLLLSPKPAIKSYLQATKLDNLKIITSGKLPANPSELLGSHRLEQLMSALNKLADFVLYDSPPLLAVTDAAVLASRVDGVIFVVKARRTRLGAAGQALATLDQVEANILGGILNQVTAKGWRYQYPRSAEVPNLNEPVASAEPVERRSG